MDRKSSEPLSQNDLQKLPKTNVAKSMRNIDDLLKESKKKEAKLNPSEERLVDLITFHQTGKRFGRFKNREEVKKPDSGILVLTKDDILNPSLKKRETAAKRNTALRGDLPLADPVVNSAVIEALKVS